MIESIKKSLQNFANFNGRATRKEFWSFYLFLLVSAFVGGIVDGIAGTTYIGNIVVIILLLPYIAVAIRRMHDVNKSGWLILVTIYNLILFLTPSKEMDVSSS